MKTIFKSILFGEVITLRRLNQRKEDCLSSLNQLKDKANRSNFPLNMTKDMIAMASNLEERHSPEYDKKDDPWVWAAPPSHLHLPPTCTSIPPANSNRKRIRLKSEGNDYLHKTKHNWAIRTTSTFVWATQKANLRCVSRPCKHCVLCGCYGNTRNPWYLMFHK